MKLFLISVDLSRRGAENCPSRWFLDNNAMHCISPYAIVVCVSVCVSVCVCVYAAFVDARKTV